MSVPVVKAREKTLELIDQYRWIHKDMVIPVTHLSPLLTKLAGSTLKYDIIDQHEIHVLYDGGYFRFVDMEAPAYYKIVPTPDPSRDEIPPMTYDVIYGYGEFTIQLMVGQQVVYVFRCDNFRPSSIKRQIDDPRVISKLIFRYRDLEWVMTAIIPDKDTVFYLRQTGKTDVGFIISPELRLEILKSIYMLGTENYNVTWDIVDGKCVIKNGPTEYVRFTSVESYWSGIEKSIVFKDGDTQVAKMVTLDYHQMWFLHSNGTVIKSTILCDLIESAASNYEAARKDWCGPKPVDPMITPSKPIPYMGDVAPKVNQPEINPDQPKVIIDEPDIKTQDPEDEPSSDEDLDDSSEIEESESDDEESEDESEDEDPETEPVSEKGSSSRSDLSSESESSKSDSTRTPSSHVNPDDTDSETDSLLFESDDE